MLVINSFECILVVFYNEIGFSFSYSGSLSPVIMYLIYEIGRQKRVIENILLHSAQECAAQCSLFSWVSSLTLSSILDVHFIILFFQFAAIWTEHIHRICSCYVLYTNKIKLTVQNTENYLFVNVNAIAWVATQNIFSEEIFCVFWKLFRCNWPEQLFPKCFYLLFWSVFV